MSDTVGGILNVLKDMGFSEERCQKALTVTGWKGVEPAMEWLLSHPEGEDDGDGDDDMAIAAAAEEAAKPVKILTEEEKAEQLKKLEELRVKKRAEREEREKQEALEKEKKRVIEGKALSQMRSQVQDQEIKKAAEERRREKLETQAAKERVRAQIEADKEARRRKAAEQRGEVVAEAAAAPAPAAAAPVVEKRNYDETRLQIRLPDGSAMKQAFKVKEPLSAVRLWVELNRKDGLAGPIRFQTNFPKKVFGEDEYAAPLEELGLVPSAVLMVMK